MSEAEKRAPMGTIWTREEAEGASARRLQFAVLRTETYVLVPAVPRHLDVVQAVDEVGEAAHESRCDGRVDEVGRLRRAFSSAKGSSCGGL